MLSIKGTLIVPNKEWKHVYNSVLNFINEEIEAAYEKALLIYTELKKSDTSYEEILSSFEEICKKQRPSDYQQRLIRSSLLSGTNNYLYSPKKNNFKKFTNRTCLIDIGSVQLEIKKKDCTINLSTEFFSNLDEYIVSNTFISEFINMVNTIPWPTRTGPSVATRGCILLTLKNHKATIFYKSGPRPPVPSLFHTTGGVSAIEDTTLSEPSHLASKMIRSIRYVNTEVSSETSQPIPEQITNNFDDYEED
ncbi:hypothetical protein CMI37_08715 [Candidatus Pacearchaeota archaeon]|nr:hypothetical protein [Candidatus Pacearchaeota archaeon]|tara:strand:- start:40 stop:789 length:750 start_codon:yes stop_codon:yes gene_type:complete